ncbi:hypothetical protein ACRQ5Q_28885 [Bradyrhizobium sp. PMVTL-01]|uniref:hypothetical protein n=1 Tax=Bradyrhizobium sp. PMVTL-01 TaxID=3434999 RepID=UPI003F72F0A9
MSPLAQDLIAAPVAALPSVAGRLRGDRQVAHDAGLQPRRAVGKALVLGRVVHEADIILSGVRPLHRAQTLGSIDDATMSYAKRIDG